MSCETTDQSLVFHKSCFQTLTMRAISRPSVLFFGDRFVVVLQYDDLDPTFNYQLAVFQDLVTFLAHLLLSPSSLNLRRFERGSDMIA